MDRPKLTLMAAERRDAEEPTRLRLVANRDIASWDDLKKFASEIPLAPVTLDFLSDTIDDLVSTYSQLNSGKVLSDFELVDALMGAVQTIPRGVLRFGLHGVDVSQLPRALAPNADRSQAYSALAVLREMVRELKRAEAADTKPACSHSPDFSSVTWFGSQYRFTKTQAAVVDFLWRAWESGNPTASEETLGEAVDPSSERQRFRVRDVFKGKEKRANGRLGAKMHPAWDTMIRVSNGIAELVEP